MKVLIVSHMVISKTSNVGKTIYSYFDGMEDVELAQFYLQMEVPTNSEVCRNYYRFTDVDAIKAVFNRKHRGIKFEKKDIQEDKRFSYLENNAWSEVYKKGKKSTPLIYMLRNILWKISNSYGEDLRNWVREFSPDIIFFVSGDYAFLYEIVYKISKDTGCPLVTLSFDDYYIYNMNKDSILGKLQHKIYMKSVKKIMKQSEVIVTICETMRKAYQELFSKRSIVLHTSSKDKQLTLEKDRKQISYIGGLGLNRDKQLIQMGRALLELQGDIGPVYIEVYSTETREDVLAQMTLENGIRFHGRVTEKEMEIILQKSMLAIHTESFDEKIKERVRFSVSTKIPELLFNGPCVLAYGPEGVASIDYLKENNVAYVMTENDDLKGKLKEIINNKELQDKILSNARKIAQKNHDSKKNSDYLQKELNSILEITNP